ncbi:MAG: ABC transporter ATP-binding protein [Chloroflexota bacterium]|nr:ABC transporter ATP-binding protein [Chloroflexota bacterium]
MKVALHARDLTIGYKRAGQPIAAHLDLTLYDGELVCLIGQNGIGKTTLLRTLAGMQPPLSGTVGLHDQDVHQLDAGALARLLSIVLTERVDPGVMIARELVALGRHPHTDWLGRLSAHDQAIIDGAIQSVGAAHLAARPVRELSDGERQKITIARALAQEPALLILDEPTAFLDLPRRVEIMRLVRRLTRERGMAALISTHDLDLALRAADRLWLLVPGMTPDALPTLIDGAPEDLILNGALAAAFQNDGAQFDPATGSFQLSAESIGVVQLTSAGGDDLRGVWTRRALERAGFRVVNDTQTANTHIETTEEGWRVMADGTTVHMESISRLIEKLRTL